ncbi:MAG: tRNA (guanosine(46)-N7)-methyltransferase TrmB [Candidatus Cloacimonetes bacterium]|nr:tRNA (guanosine(46)-N7)-methyltransferase TrmB [Candidatus Cloacimonadota bacterium]
MMTIQEKEEFFCIPHKDNELLDFRAIFGNDNPVYMEIGCGKGELIATKSLVEWDRNFLGIEVKGDRIRIILHKLDASRHANVRLMRLYVDDSVINIIPRHSIRKIFIIHPDPWPKRKHHKNRIIQDSFLDTLNQILRLRGEIEIATDHQEYVMWIVEHFARRKDFVALYEKGYTTLPRAGHIVTYYEEFKRKEGYPPYFMRFRKTDHLPLTAHTPQGDEDDRPETTAGNLSAESSGNR